MTEPDQPNDPFGLMRETPSTGNPKHDSVPAQTSEADGFGAIEELFADTAAIDAAVARSTEPVRESAPAPVAEEPAQSGDEHPGQDQPSAWGFEAQPTTPFSDEAAAPVSVSAVAGWGAAPAPGFTEPAMQTVYVPAPLPPKRKNNRGFAALITLIASGVFAALYAGLGYGYLSVTGIVARVFPQFLESPIFWGVVALFFLSHLLLGALINRGRGWAHSVFSWFIAAVVYFGTIALTLVAAAAWSLTAAEAAELLRQSWLSPYAIIAAILAREVPIWFGGWIARNGQKVTARNEAAMDAYDREVAAGPLFQ